MRLKLETVAEWTGGTLCGGGGAPEVYGVSTDSRTLRRGELFVALRGPAFDGHDYVDEAFAKGAAGALVERSEALGDRPGVAVGDTFAALGELAHRYRWQEHLIPWVAVTGSNGKTTTREILAHLLRTRGEVVSSRKNYNNRVGVPLTILEAPDDAWAGVLEMGTSAPGEIARLAAIATPTVAIVTNVGPAHLEGFGTLEAVAEEKGSVYERLPEDGLAIYPGHDAYADVLLRHVSGARVAFAVGWPADMTAENVHADGEGIRFQVRGVDFSAPLLGVHNIGNCMAALLAAEHLGINLVDAVEPLRTLSPLTDRLQPQRTAYLTILDDSYNANPSSLRVAVETMLLFDAPRRVAIVGDMMELGRESRTLHREIGRFLTAMGLDMVLAVGKQSVVLAETASTACVRCSVKHYQTVPSLLLDLKRLLREDDLVLVKGSRGMHMERVVEALGKWRPRASRRRRA